MILYSGERSAYDEAIVSSSRTWQANYQYYRSSWITGTQAHLKSFTISDYVSDGSNISMGNVAGGKLTVNLVNVYSSDLKAILSSSKIRIKLGLMGSVSVVSRSYVIDDKKITKRFNGRYDCTITAYDLSYKMTDTYITSLENPTCIQIVTEIAEKYGLTVDNSVSEAVSAIDGSTAATFVPLEGFTCKQTLGFMAGCYGCFATINENDAICFKWFEESPDTIAPDRIFEGCEFISEMSERKIKLVESGTQSNPVVAPSNTSGYSISFENPYITQEQATAIYNNKVSGNKISFRVGKLKYKGSPLNNPGTIVTVKDIEEKTAKFYIMKRTLDFDGGLSETIECQGESDTTISYKISSPTQQRINRALSKMESAIKAATDVIQQTKGSTFELIPSDESDPAKGNLGFNLYYKDSGDTAFDNCIIKATAGGIGFSTNAGESFDALAMYFYKDESGEIHGCINGEVIKAGSISADKIDTSQLVISKGNVDGLTDEISSISAVANGAKETAISANTMAVNVRDGLVTTNQNVSNLNNKYSNLSEEQKKIINICLNNDMTYINGGNIATGSILSDSIAANSVTADKLSVGYGKLENMLSNSEFTDDSSFPVGWDYYNSFVEQKSSTAYIKYTDLSSRMLKDSIAEFEESKNFYDNSTGITTDWILSKCTARTLGNYPNGYIELTPTDISYWAFFERYYNLTKGKRYYIAAQINILNYYQNTSSGYGIGLCYAGGNYNLPEASFSPVNGNTGEFNIEFVFDYSKDSGSKRVGLIFKYLANSSGSPVKYNIAWLTVGEVKNPYKTQGFYCSDSRFLASGYKSSNLLNNGTLINSAEEFTAYESYMSSSDKTDVNIFQLFTQKKQLESGKRYSLIARLKCLNFESASSIAAFGCWAEKGHSFYQTQLGSTNTNNYITVKMVFDYSGETVTKDVGLYWRGLLDDISQPCDIQVNWIYLFRDDTDEPGFYCSDSSWLKDGYKESHIITNSSDINNYIKKPALQVNNSNLYFFGSVQSNSGNIGCLNYSFDSITIKNDSYYYQDVTKPKYTLKQGKNSIISFSKPSKILDGESYSGGVELCDVMKWQSAYQRLYLETREENNSLSDSYENIVSPAGMKATYKSKSISLSTDGIVVNGSNRISLDQLIYLANHTPSS